MKIKTQITLTVGSGVDYIGVKMHDPDMDFRGPTIGEAWAYPNDLEDKLENELLVYNVFVLPAYGRKGYGGRLMNELIMTAESYDYRSLFLKSSRQGLGLYRKLGFQHTCTEEELITQLTKKDNIKVSIPMRKHLVEAL